MTGRGAYRESELPEVPPGRGPQLVDGRRCISVIGIDRYRRWTHLNNAVSDARGVLTAFEHLGFVPVVAPLLEYASAVFVTRPPGPRGLEAAELARLARGVPVVVLDDPADALRAARASARRREIVCVTGSLALVGRARDVLELPIAERLW